MKAPAAALTLALCLLGLSAAELAPADQPRPAPLPTATVSAAATPLPAKAAPSARRIAAAKRYLARRKGVASLALVDTSGRMHTLAGRRTYVSASVIKALLMTTYLRKIRHRAPTAAERRLLGPMLSVSDNNAAFAVQRLAGNAAVRRVAARAHMTDFHLPGSTSWTRAYFSARDQARLFWRIERLLPPRHRRYGLRLLSSIIPAQRWGFTAAAHRSGYAVYMKGGWRTTGTGALVHEVALLRRGRARIALAVLTDGNPSHAYATQTLRGVSRRLLTPR